MITKKQFISFTLFLFILLNVFFIASCGGEKKEEIKVLKIGVIFPMTGNLGFIGDLQKKSLDLSVNDNPNIKLIYEDSKGSPKDAINAAYKLKNVDKISVVISLVSFISESIAKQLEEADIPHFILSFSPQLPHKHKLIIRFFTSSTSEANQFVNYILENKYKKVSFLRHMEPDAEKAFLTLTKPTLENNGITVIDIPFPLDTKDFSVFVQKIKESTPDLIVIQAFAHLIPQIKKRIDEYKIKAPILGDLNFLDLEHFPESDIKLIERIPFVGVNFVLEDKYKKFVAAYKRKYNEKPYALGAFCYDLGKALIEYFNKNKSTEAKDIINYFKGKSFDGVCGKTQIDEYGDFHLNYKILIYKNGEMVKY